LAAPARAGERCGSAPTSPLVVNVKDKGAKGEGQPTIRPPFRRQSTRRCGSVSVPKGTYMIDAENHLSMTLKLSKDATLKAIPNESEK
jgi:hypothetical protein